MGVADDPPPQPPHPSDGNDEHGNDGQTGERQDGMYTDRSSAAGNATTNPVVVTPGASSSGSVVRRPVSDDEEVKEYVDGAEVYDLLLKNGCVDENGRFIWRSGSSIAEETMSEEIQNFLLDVKRILLIIRLLIWVIWRWVLVVRKLLCQKISFLFLRRHTKKKQ
jgi:hypothetical protein